jgi:hypothetical protein
MASLPKVPLVCQAPSLIVPDVIPYLLPGGGISILAGAPNVGKTALLSKIVRDLRDSRPIFGHQPRALPGIGVINADRNWSKGAGLWFDRVGFPDITHYSISDDATFNPKRLRKKHERTDLLASFADRLELPPGSLLVIDPIALFLGGNLLDYDACMIACHEIRAYLRQREYTLLASAHSAKLKADKRERYMRMQDQVLGSTAITGFSDSALYLASPQETGKEYYLLVWHPHGAKEQTFALERDEQGLFVPYTGVDSGTQARVLALFPVDGSEIALVAVVELAEAIPLSRKTVQRALEALVDRGTVIKLRRGAYQRVTIN